VGWEQGKTSNTYAVALEAMNRDVNIVGNVLGKLGYHDTYECANATCNTDTAIYYLGYEGTGGSLSGYDSMVPSTLLRHGNYDYATQSITWDPAITSTALPPSLYLSAKPAWFGDRPWPAIDPFEPNAADDITRIPAGYRFTYGQDPPGAVN